MREVKIKNKKKKKIFFFFFYFCFSQKQSAPMNIHLLVYLARALGGFLMVVARPAATGEKSGAGAG
jgi:hypothetical protein